MAACRYSQRLKQSKLRKEAPMTDTYRLAGRNITISTRYDEVHRLCADYRIDDTAADFSVATDENDIAYERSRSAGEAELEGRPAPMDPPAYLESLAVYRKIAEHMPDYDTFLMHGSCVAVDGVAYLFTAKSGTGKSTHTRLWRELLGDRAFMVNDDKPLICVGAGDATAYGTPWDGKHRLSRNVAVPLRAICVLTRSDRNWIEPIPGPEAYPILLQQIFRPRDPASLRKTLSLIDRLTNVVSFWRLGCRPDPDAARVAWQAMRPTP